MSTKRSDTDVVLQSIMKGDKSAFETFYGRYRGRIFRFIVRQYGNGDFGKAAYYSAWRHLIISSRTSKSTKELKFSFYQNLGRSSHAHLQQKHTETQSNYLPRDIEEDGKWSLVFIEQFRYLPEAMKKRFLFKHEIGLNPNAIANIIDDKPKHIEKAIEEAERILRTHMDEAGCPENISIAKLYRESRVVKPPRSWDSEILDSFTIWLKQTGSLSSVVSVTDSETQDPKLDFGEKLSDWITTVKIRAAKLKLGNKGKKPSFSISRR